MIWLAAGIAAIALNGTRVVTARVPLYAVSTSGKHVAFCGDSRKIDVDKRTIELPDGWCLALAFSPDGQQLAAGTSEKQVLIFDVASGKQSRALETNWSTAAVAWSSDGKMIAAGSYGVRLWKASDGTLIRKLDAPAAIHGIAFSRDGARIAAAGRDKVVRVWNASTGELLRTIEPVGFAHWTGTKFGIEPETMPQVAVDFAPDGKTLATGGADRLVRVWDIDSGKELQRFEGHRATITAVRFIDENRLVSGSLDGTVKFWSLK